MPAVTITFFLLCSYLPSPSVNFTLVFDGVQLIDPARLNGIIVFSKQTDGVAYFTIGDLLVDKTDDVVQYFLMLDMISTHAYPYTTTPTPGRYELMMASSHTPTPGRYELMMASSHTPTPVRYQLVTASSHCRYELMMASSHTPRHPVGMS